MKKLVTALLIASILSGPCMAAEQTVQKALICKAVIKHTSWRDVDMKKTLHGAYLMSTWFYWKNGRYDLSQHILFNEGADEAFGHPFVVFSMMLGKEMVDKTGFGWSDIFLGNLPPLLFYVNWGKAYRTTARFLGRNIPEPPPKPFIMKDNDGKRYACTFVDQKLLDEQLKIQEVNNIHN